MEESSLRKSLLSDERPFLSSSDRTGPGNLNQFNLQNVDILESITDAFAAFDSEWRFVYVNSAAERLLGMPRSQLIGQCHWDLFAGTLGTVVEWNYRRAAAERVTAEFEFFYEPWKRWFSITCYPAANGGLTNYFRDVTEAKQIQHDLRQQNRALERANRLLEEFAYISSHDLQEPIRNIKLTAELLREEAAAASAELQQFADMIHQSAGTLETLVRDLLAYSRVIADENEGGIAVADLSECWRQALDVMRASIVEANADVSAGPLPRVKGNPLQLAHVFQNLLSNSLKYRRAGVTSRIEISAKQEGANWTVSVRDNGIGFEPRHAERIFGLFKRLHSEKAYPGTGLGLAICRRVVERYGGRIWAEGRPGEGACVYMTLPDADAAVSSHGFDASAAPDSQKLRAIPGNEN